MYFFFLNLRKAYRVPELQVKTTTNNKLLYQLYLNIFWFTVLSHFVTSSFKLSKCFIIYVVDETHCNTFTLFFVRHETDSLQQQKDCLTLDSYQTPASPKQLLWTFLQWNLMPPQRDSLHRVLCRGYLLYCTCFCAI